MTKRILTQLVVWFLLGMASAYFRSFALCVFAGILWYVMGFYVQYRKSDWKKKQSKTTYVFFFVMYLLLCLVVGGMGFLRFHQQQKQIKEIESHLKNNHHITVIGKIYKKEVKNKSILYYLKHSKYFQNQQEKKCNQILVDLTFDSYLIGDTIVVKGDCESFSVARNEGSFHEKNYYYSKNILFRMKAGEIQLLKRESFSWKENLYQLRKKISHIYQVLLPEQEAGILSVMTLGEKSFLDREIKELYQDSGISHVLAISGLHISIIGMGIYRFLRKIGISYVGAGVVSGILIYGFGHLSGMEVSTVRAILMFLFMIFGNMTGMCYDSITAWSFSMLLNLWENPYNIINSGFLFSYAAVLAIVVVSNVLRVTREEKGEKKKEGSWICWIKQRIKSFFETCGTSFSIQLVTLPLTAFFYYEFPVYSIFINGLLLPFMGIILILGLLAGLLGILYLPIAKILIFPVYLLLYGIKWICSLFQELPWNMWMMGQPPIFSIVCYYVFLIFTILYLSRRKQKSLELENMERGNKHGETFRKHRKHRNRICQYGENLEKRVAAFCLFVVLLLVLMVKAPEKAKICFLDVGQGDGIYLQSKEGTSFFIDGGSSSEFGLGKYTILNFLKYHGITSMDGWFVSHLDQDHISGLLEVLEAGYPIKNLFLSEYVIRDSAWEEICTMAEKYGTHLVYLKKGDCVGSVGMKNQGMKFTCLFPWEEEAEKNDSSMVLYVECAGYTALFTGDTSEKQEKKLLQEYPNLKVDFYKAAHHGSNNSNSVQLLNQIRPSISIISCARNNSYGHPGKEAVKRFEECGSRIFYTMESGQITIKCEETGFLIQEYFK